MAVAIAGDLLYRSRVASSLQSTSPRLSAAIAENGSNVSHSTRSKCAIFGPAVKPIKPSLRGWYPAKRSKAERAPLTCSGGRNR